MARTWLSIKVELVEGRDEHFWPRPGRVFAEGWDATDQTDDRQAKLSRLQLGERFVYVFDLADGWTHLCTVDTQRVDPPEVLGLTPGLPLPYFGWGDLPDQYRRRWEHDDGESDPPPDPELADLPPLRPWWGSQKRWGKN
jgi:hypothetical protein